MGRMPARVLRPAIVAVAVAVLGACSAPQYSYVHDGGTKSSLRVPSGWTVYNEDLSSSAPLSSASGAPSGFRYLVGLDADPSAPPDVSLKLASEYPQGIAFVRDLSFNEFDRVSMFDLRNVWLPVDALVKNDNNGAVVSYALDGGGAPGVDLVFKFRAGALPAAEAEAASAQARATMSGTGSALSAVVSGQLLDWQRALITSAEAMPSDAVVQFDQRAFVDPVNQQLYFFIIMCSVDCYTHNQAAIEAAVSSWTVNQ
jgi:hypothetical protein